MHNVSRGSLSFQADSDPFVDMLKLQEQCMKLVTTATSLYAIDFNQLARQMQTFDPGDDATKEKNLQSMLQYIGIDSFTVKSKPPLEDRYINDSICGMEKDAFNFDIFEFVKANQNISVSCYTLKENVPIPLNSTISKTLRELTLGCGYNLNLNLIEINEQVGLANNLVVEVGSLLMEETLGVIYSGNSWKKALMSLLGNIQRCYRQDVSYHNQLHAAEVAHLLVYLLNQIQLLRRVSTEKFTATELSFLPSFSNVDAGMGNNTAPPQQLNGSLAFVVAVLSALAHDVAHPGKTNNYLINSGTPLAIIYNDKSVLENYHSCILFQLIKQPSNNIFGTLSFSEWRMVRRIIIEMILATDMAFHFEFIGELRARRQAVNFKHLQNETDGWILTKNCLKLADIGHAFLVWDLHKEFSDRVCKEIMIQEEDEVRFQLPRSPLCLTENAQSIPKSQSSFLQFIVTPLLEEMQLAQSQANLHQIVDQVQQNTMKWEAMRNVGTENAKLEERAT
ncbi:3'5'-cyclic nucleotide phosphodiesterase domain-containing protein [Cardiosporidium cionae]|uniref:Phosphodiesterase n=1 Tax=Cardiosporidium cionae TaxID=476202 RepID=A0ABQ7J892_9APIC|nr:3'5'-cyclic nucleotide phosphodiesterase domain-containing protein [Cardiosporidium cionae]|eukprot:KAF8820202.1 3'5'-cyclic nucleotide phosphodiesterase domain-containing protein [Cardiosporidium cionae]